MASKAEKLGDFGEEEQELDLEEDNFKPRITDLLENNHYFKEVIKFLFIYFCLFMLRERNVVHTALSSPEGKRSRRRPPLIDQYFPGPTTFDRMAWHRETKRADST